MGVMLRTLEAVVGLQVRKAHLLATVRYGGLRRAEGLAEFLFRSRCGPGRLRFRETVAPTLAPPRDRSAFPRSHQEPNEFGGGITRAQGAHTAVANKSRGAGRPTGGSTSF